MPGRVQHFQPEIANFEHVAVGNVDGYVRGGRVMLHHNFRIRQIGQVEGAAAMVCVGMGVDQVIEPKGVVDGDRDITARYFPSMDRSTPRAASVRRPAGRSCIYPGSIHDRT